MSFGASADIWGDALLPDVQHNLAELARTIAKYEPVSMLVRRQDRATAERMVQGTNVTLVDAAVDDLWIRDTGPSFVVNTAKSGECAGVQFNFNGWGNKQAHANDARVASVVADKAGVPMVRTPLVMEGGCIEVDGRGTAIVTESCVLNDNRNPGLGKLAYEAELKRILGVSHVIWLPGIKGRDITDGHTDFYARFAGPGVVLAGFDPDPQSYDHAVTKAHLQILRNAKDAQGKKLEVMVLQAPETFSKKYDAATFAAGYIGFYLCNGAVIAQKFGDAKADSASRLLLQQVFPGRVVEQLRMDAIAAGGGSVHCATQQQPKV
jgi:agmatine deiminase